MQHQHNSTKILLNSSTVKTYICLLCTNYKVLASFHAPSKLERHFFSLGTSGTMGKRNVWKLIETITKV